MNMSLFNKIGALFAARPEDRRISHAASIIEATLGSQVLSLPQSREKLFPVVLAALDYYDGVIAAIPGPIDIACADHQKDPRIQALFRSADDIPLGLGRSIALRNGINWFAEQGHDSVLALMGMRLAAPEASAAAAEGGAAPAEPVDHTFRNLGEHVEDVRAGLREAAFTALIKGFAADLKEQVRVWRLQPAEKRPGQAGSGVEPVDLQLAQAGDLATLDRLLIALVAWLQTPERQLAIETTDQSIFLPAIAAGESPCHLPLLATADRRKWLACLVRFPLLDGVNASARETRAHRYILI
jgi:hypothetical protein